MVDIMRWVFFFFTNVPQRKATQQAAKFGNVWCCVDWSTACLLLYILVGPVLCSLHDTLSQSLHQSWLITVHYSETTRADTVFSRFTVCYISTIFLYLSLINMLSLKSKSTLFVSYLHDMAYRSLNCVYGCWYEFAKCFGRSVHFTCKDHSFINPFLCLV